MAAASEGLGPYPRVDRSDILQRDSFAALVGAVPNDRFILRDERQADKGLDFSIELLIDSHATNIRAHGQLKSTDNPAINSDGSVSYSVETKNLNYLLNGDSPLYVLWLASHSELRFAWARDEARRLHTGNSDWQAQQTVTVRFTERLDDGAWDSIYARLRREGQLNRRYHDTLMRTGSTRAVLSVDPSEATITSAAEAFTWLTENGSDVVSAGYGSAVQEWANLLNPVQAADPRVQLALAYAASVAGNHFTARGHVAQAILRRNGLDEFDRSLLDLIKTEADYRVASIGEDEYEARKKAIEDAAPPVFAVQLQLDRVRQELSGERDEGRRASRRKELDQLADQLLSDTNTPEPMKVQVEIVRLVADSADSGFDLVQVFARGIARQSNSTPPSRAELIDWTKASEKSKRVIEKAAALVQRAHDTGHPLLIAESLVAEALNFVIHISQTRIALAVLGGSPARLPDKVLIPLTQKILTAAEVFRRLGHYEGQVRAGLLLAQLFDVSNDADAAKRAATSVRGIILAMGYNELEPVADGYERGCSAYRQLLQQVASPTDQDEHMVGQTDAEVRRVARFALDAHSLPIDRLPVIERACFVHRAVAAQRMEWCRHIELLEEQPPRGSWRRGYATDPEWQGHCELRKHRSRISLQDSEAVLNGFKCTYCAGCPDRSPKRPSHHATMATESRD